MWQPFASLPPSNFGALAPYAQQQGQQTGMAPTAINAGPGQPVVPQVPLHPIFGGQRGGLAGSMGDPNSFAAALAAWRQQMPDFRGVMGGGGMDKSMFGDFRNQMQDWRQLRPVRADF